MILTLKYVHVHVGEQIAGYVVKNGEWELIGTRSPQDAQVGFIPFYMWPTSCMYCTSSAF